VLFSPAGDRGDRLFVAAQQLVHVREDRMLAYDYPLLGVFFTILWLAMFVIWIWLLVVIFGDIFRSHDMGGVAKTLWVILVVFLPFFGILFYLLFRGPGMPDRARQRGERQEREFRDYVEETAGGPDPADELSRLAALRDQGVLTDAEFEAEKAKILP
jgi:hypothetical protein